MGINHAIVAGGAEPAFALIWAAISFTTETIEAGSEVRVQVRARLWRYSGTSEYSRFVAAPKHFCVSSSAIDKAGVDGGTYAEKLKALREDVELRGGVEEAEEVGVDTSVDTQTCVDIDTPLDARASRGDRLPCCELVDFSPLGFGCGDGGLGVSVEFHCYFGAGVEVEEDRGLGGTSEGGDADVKLGDQMGFEVDFASDSGVSGKSKS